MKRGQVRLMSLEPSSHLPGGFQITHRTLGIYQGSAIELAFWYPSSGMPEYGLCRFATKEKAESYRAYLCSPACPEPLNEHDLTIEPYDLAAHEELISKCPPSNKGMGNKFSTPKLMLINAFNVLRGYDSSLHSLRPCLRNGASCRTGVGRVRRPPF